MEVYCIDCDVHGLIDWSKLLQEGLVLAVLR
jgi:hypothetical protein